MKSRSSDSENQVRQAPQRSSRWVFSLLYIGVIGAVIYFNIASLGGDNLLSTQTWILAVILLLLLAVERFEQRWSGIHEPIQIAITLLLIRAGLLAAVTALDPSGLSTILYPIIPYAAYFSLNERAGDLIAIIVWLIYIGITWLTGSAWYANNPLISAVVFTLILIFMMTMARAIHADDQNRQHTEKLLADLEISHQKLQVFADQVGELAAMEERNRLAREIHDSLGHYLTAVNIQLEKALAYQEIDPEEAEQSIRFAKQSASEALRDVRRSVRALRDVDDYFSLEYELSGLLMGMEGQNITLEFNFHGNERSYQRLTLMTLFRAAQEGLTNIQKHAFATRVFLEVDLGDKIGRLILRDNGKGFETRVLDELASATDHSFGLQGIQERLELVGGQVQVTSDPDRGTQLIVSVPRKPMESISERPDYLPANISS